MLAARIVKLRAAPGGVASGRGAQPADEASVARVTANLDHLARELSSPPSATCWRRRRIAGGPCPRCSIVMATRPRSGPIDAAAEELLVAAEALTAALAAASPLPTLGVINRAGRQRMLSQRWPSRPCWARWPRARPGGAPPWTRWPASRVRGGAGRTGTLAAEHAGHPRRPGRCGDDLAALTAALRAPTPARGARP